LPDFDNSAYKTGKMSDSDGVNPLKSIEDIAKMRVVGKYPLIVKIFNMLI